MIIKTHLCIALALTGVGPATVPVAPSEPSPASAAVETRIWTCTVQAWHLSSAGAISVQLSVPSEEGEPRSYWFRTPGVRSGVIQFEQLFLRILLDIEADQTTHLHAERDASGATLGEAMTIQAISSSAKTGQD